MLQVLQDKTDNQDRLVSLEPRDKLGCGGLLALLVDPDLPAIKASKEPPDKMEHKVKKWLRY